MFRKRRSRDIFCRNWKSIFTTDGSSLRAIEVGADIMLKGTRVDGIYTADPEKRFNGDEIWMKLVMMRYIIVI